MSTLSCSTCRFTGKGERHERQIVKFSTLDTRVEPPVPRASTSPPSSRGIFARARGTPAGPPARLSHGIFARARAHPAGRASRHPRLHRRATLATLGECAHVIDHVASRSRGGRRRRRGRRDIARGGRAALDRCLVGTFARRDRGERVGGARASGSRLPIRPRASSRALAAETTQYRRAASSSYRDEDEDEDEDEDDAVRDDSESLRSHANARRLRAKTALLNAARLTDRGLNVGGAARRAELNERVAALEATAASAFRDNSDGDAFSKESSLFSSSLLSGVWRLVYTDAFETLAVLRIANAMPGVTAGRLTQTIRDLDGARADSVSTRRRRRRVSSPSRRWTSRRRC